MMTHLFLSSFGNYKNPTGSKLTSAALKALEAAIIRYNCTAYHTVDSIRPLLQVPVGCVKGDPYPNFDRLLARVPEEKVAFSYLERVL